MSAKKRVLFFIDGPIPTTEDRATAAKLGTEMFRNAQQVSPGETLESCDAVAGSVPAPYSKLPRADKAAQPAAAPAAQVEPEAPAAEEPAPEVPVKAKKSNKK